MQILGYLAIFGKVGLLLIAVLAEGRFTDFGLQPYLLFYFGFQSYLLFYFGFQSYLLFYFGPHSEVLNYFKFVVELHIYSRCFEDYKFA